MTKFLSWLIGNDANVVLLNQNSLKDSEVASSFNSLIKYAEYKRVFEQMISHGEKHPFKTISVLSQEVGEGKTLFASLFAYSYSHILKKRVLIIDTQTKANGKSHVLDQIFEVEDSNGNNFQPRPTFQIGIDIIHIARVAENQNKANSEYTIQVIIEKYSDKYDLIIVDTCAISLRNQNNFDPIVISNRLDTTVYVTSTKSLESSFIVELKEKMKLNPRFCMGVVFNRGCN
jgi:Mrp family chromosome partitioning ATPase